MAVRCGILVLPLVLTVIEAGGCGDAWVDPIQVAPECPESPLRGPAQWATEAEDLLIDDFEDGDGRIAKVSGRNGVWTLGTDGSDGNLVAEASPHCAARGTKAGHFAGSGFSSWCANWTAVFVSQDAGVAVPYNGRSYTGISFWAAAGGDAAEPLEAPLGVITMDNAWNGGVCTTKCMDFYGARIPLTHSWSRTVIKFADLVQSGWGVPQTAMKLDQLVGFIIWPNHQFDVWIDDIRFEP